MQTIWETPGMETKSYRVVYHVLTANQLHKMNMIGEPKRLACASALIFSIKPGGKPTTEKSSENLVISNTPNDQVTSIPLISLLLPAPKS